MSGGIPVKDENPEMEKQIGCINGFLQLFDMQYFINGRRRVNQKRLQSGHHRNQLAEPKCTLQISPVKTMKILGEKQRISTESSSTSCSSSSTPCSSFSSLDSSRSAQLRISTQHLLTNRTLNSQKFNPSLDLQDAQKNSIYREARGLSVKTVTGKPAVNSPRPTQPPKFSMRRVSDSNLPQKMDKMIGGNLFQLPKCSHRHSYDGRELHGGLKSSTKLKELPRLSLDSRLYRSRCSISGTRSSDSFNRTLIEQKEPANLKKTSTVIAKLMGLEPFPDLTSPREYKPDRSSRSETPVQTPLCSREVSTKSPRTASSVYGEIEKRVATLEFKESGKDLRALKQILEAMQKSNSTSQSSNTSILDMRIDNLSDPAMSAISPKSSKSPIIIMKPGNITKKVPGLQKLHVDHFIDNRKDKLKIKIPTDLSPRYSHPRYSHPRDTSRQPLSPTEKRTSTKIMSPRLHQNFGPEKQSLSSPRTQYIRHRTQPCSADKILKNKPQDLHQNSNAHVRKKRNDIRGLSQNKNASSLKSESIQVLAQDMDQKGISTYEKNSITGFSRIEQMEEPPMPSFEQPSPVSVLDSAFYPDDLSPIKKKLYTFQDDDTLSENEDEVWLECETQSPNMIEQVDTETNNKKSEKIQHLRKDLRQLRSNNEEKIVAYIPLLNGRANPHHAYISEILSASGLLRAFESGLASPQLHSSGHIINPNLFFALEQTQNRNWSSNNERSSIINMPKPDCKAQRRLVFDTVNEILTGETEARGSFKLNIMEICTKMKANQILKDLCAQVDQLQTGLNENDNYAQMLGYDDSNHQSRNWTGSQNEISGLVLDVERLIFKDLITEVVISEAGILQD